MRNQRLKINRQRVLIALLMLSIVATIAGDLVSKPVRRIARIAMVPVSDAGMYLVTALESRLDNAEQEVISQDEARTLKKSNRILKRKVHLLMRRIQRDKQRLRDIQRIRGQLYGPTHELPSELIPARVVGGDSLPYNATRVLNTGSESHAAEGMFVTTRRILTNRSRALPRKLAVISASALVGRLSETDSFTARVQLLTDRGFEVPVLIHRVANSNDPRRVIVETLDGPAEEVLRETHPDIPAIAKGDGDKTLRIPRVQAPHNVKPGDEVYTRPTDTLIGAPIPVGTVVKVTEDEEKPGLFKTLHVKPHANLEAIRDVYVIVPPGGVQ